MSAARCLRISPLLAFALLTACGGDEAPSRPPIEVAAQPAAQVCVGDGHVCELRDGAVRCRGRGLDGQLGDGGRFDRHGFVTFAESEGATALACGDRFTCVLVGDAVRCAGALPDGASAVLDGPADALDASAEGLCVRHAGELRCAGVRAPNVDDVRLFSVREGEACVVTGGGKLRCGGRAAMDLRGPVRALVARGERVCLALRDRVACGGPPLGAHDPHADAFGHDAYAEAPHEEAHDEHEDEAAQPLRAGGLASLPGLGETRALALGPDHLCAVAARGTVRCLGEGRHGQLGNGESRPSANPVPALGLEEATAIAAGRGLTCAREGDATLRCFGDGSYGLFDAILQTAAHPTEVTGDAEPSAIAAGESARAEGYAIDAGDRHVCWQAPGERPRCLGDGRRGQLGHGATLSEGPASPAALPAGEGFALGGDMSCQRAGGEVRCWGEGGAGLGVGERGAGSIPRLVPFEGDLVDIAASRRVGCGVGPGGVACFGSGAFAMLEGSRADRPTAIADVPGGLAIALGTAFGCVLTEGGGLSCWGSRAPSTRRAPRGLVAIDAYDSNGCARDGRGRVFCWGSQEAGAVGDRVDARRGRAEAPTLVRDLPAASAIAVGTRVACALDADAEMRCWGRNRDGECGQGDLAGPAVLDPEPVVTSPAVGALGRRRAIACGRGFCCAVHDGGALSCSGRVPGGARTKEPVVVYASRP